MCDNWRKEHAKEVSCEGVVLDSGDGEFIVKGHVIPIIVSNVTKNIKIM